MRSFLRSSRIALVCLGMLMAWRAGAAETPDQKAVRARSEALVKALNAHDEKAARAFYDPSFVRAFKDGTVKNYKQQIADLSVLSRNKAIVKATNMKMTAMRDAIGVVWDYDMAATPPQGKSYRVKGRSLQIWKKLHGQWLLVRIDQQQ